MRELSKTLAGFWMPTKQDLVAFRKFPWMVPLAILLATLATTVEIHSYMSNRLEALDRWIDNHPLETVLGLMIGVPWTCIVLLGLMISLRSDVPQQQVYLPIETPTLTVTEAPEPSSTSEPTQEPTSTEASKTTTTPVPAATLHALDHFVEPQSNTVLSAHANSATYRWEAQATHIIVQIDKYDCSQPGELILAMDALAGRYMGEPHGKCGQRIEFEVPGSQSSTFQLTTSWRLEDDRLEDEQEGPLPAQPIELTVSGMSSLDTR